MPIDEFKLNLAFELTSKGEDFAAQGKYSDAVTKLKQALDIYNTCGLPETERIKTVEMINSQISEFTKLLNNSLSSSINIKSFDKYSFIKSGIYFFYEV